MYTPKTHVSHVPHTTVAALDYAQSNILQEFKAGKIIKLQFLDRKTRTLIPLFSKVLMQVSIPTNP